MGEMGDRSRAIFAEAYNAVGLDFTLEEQARAGTQNGSGISKEAATGEASQRKLKVALRRKPDANALTILKA